MWVIFLFFWLVCTYSIINLWTVLTCPVDVDISNDKCVTHKELMRPVSNSSIIWENPSKEWMNYFIALFDLASVSFASVMRSLIIFNFQSNWSSLLRGIEINNFCLFFEFFIDEKSQIKMSKKEESEEHKKEVKEWKEKKEGNDWTYSLSSLFHFPIRLNWFIAKHPKTKEKGNKTRHVQVHMQTSVSINIRYPSSISGRSSTVDCDYLIKQTRKKLCGYLFPWPFELQ